MEEEEDEDGQCGRANCSILNGLLRGGMWLGVGGACTGGASGDEEEKLLRLVSGELGVNNDDMRDPRELSEVGDGFGCG